MTKTNPDTSASRAKKTSNMKVRNYLARDRNEERLGYVDRLLARFDPVNHDEAARYLAAKKAQGLRPNSLQGLMVRLRSFDEACQGTPWHELREADLARILCEYAATHSPASVKGFAVVVRAYYRWANDDETPKHVRRGLKRKAGREMKDVQIISQAELHALLKAAEDMPDPKDRVRVQALIWVLWDSGFRIGEATSLRIEDVLFDDKGGARLRLVDREDANLKTGPRTVYVVECVAALKVWLSLHPCGDEGQAALFPSQVGWRKPMWSNSPNKTLTKLCQQAGVRHLNPHLFRHTRATRAAKAKWGEAKMRGYFGWSPNSNMPAHYTHMAERDMEAQVRQDAGIDAEGFRLAQQRGDDAAALAELLQKALNRNRSEDTATRAPQDWQLP